MGQRIIRDYRQMKRLPARFLAFIKKVKHSLTDNRNYPETAAALLQQYFQSVDNFETIYHLALDGSRTQRRERDRLIAEIVVLLDQIASLLEAAHILDSDALLTTGFTVTQERRSSNRIKLSLEAPPDFKVENLGDRGKAVATASSFTGALNCEIHINHRDPAVDEDWLHKAIFPNSKSMEMDNLVPGNVFFRMRYHGHDGPGPWSTIVSTTIT